MKLVQLEHDTCLGMPKGKQLLEVPQDVIEQCCKAGSEYFLTFRKLQKSLPKEYFRNIHACTRMNNIYDGDLSFYALETDSPFAPLMIWDIAHTLSIGGVLRFYGENISEYTLQKPYYQNAFHMISQDKNVVLFEKVAALAIEADRGLEDWTFGIPTGPGDATILNAVVKRILEIPCRNKEIILCGRPGNNFKYWEQVKIVGEDIIALPIQISKKKNRIAENASYGNLCILHDRVFLPSDFLEAMKKYGDDYSTTTLQCVYFDDYYNLCPHRYSDYGVLESEQISDGIAGINEEDDIEQKFKSYIFNPNIVNITDKKNIFFTQNPLRNSSKSYATGSLYIIKRSIWLKCPLDEQLNWENFEDVEWGIRSYSFGIPHRINPYSLSQSVISRPLLLADIRNCLPNGKKRTLAMKQWILPLRRKPMFKCTVHSAWSKLLEFKEKYCPNLSLQVKILTSKYRAKTILKLLNCAEFEMTKENIKLFLYDVERLLLLGSFPSAFKEYMYNHFLRYGRDAIYDIMIYYDFEKQLALRIGKNQFMDTVSDYGVKFCFNLKIGTLVTAFLFTIINKKIYFHPDGLWGYYKSILKSTPYKRYFLED